jgi:plastocyanin
MSHFRLLLLLTAGTVIWPASAPAATKVVDAGVPLASHRAFWTLGSDANAFFPSRVTIRVGDTVRFRPSGFHTVHLRGRRGRTTVRSLVPSAARVAGAVDAAGQPFWFNGQVHFDNAPALLKTNFGKRFTFTGAKELTSGFHTKGRAKPMSVRFTRPGTFRFICDYHPGMQGSVKVVPRSSRSVPSARRDAAGVRQTLGTLLKAAATLKQARPPAGVINVGNAGPGGLEFYDFVPKVVQVPAGSTVRFQISPGSLETHTVAAGPGLPDTQRASYLGLIAHTFEERRADPRAVYPSDPPGTPPVLTPTTHGNGFWSSGVLDRSPATPFPEARDLTFPVAGTYLFSCLIHKYMHTQVQVT